MEIQTEELLDICRAFAETRSKAVSSIRDCAIQTTVALEWSDTLCDGESVDYETAEKACAARGEGWRLPTRMELESILDLTRHDPAIDTARFPYTKSVWYWTSTPCAWDASCAWIVSFSDGCAGSYSHRDLSACVRAVRSVPAGQ